MRSSRLPGLAFDDHHLFVRTRNLFATRINSSNPTIQHFHTLERELDEYFAGKRKTFSVVLFTPGSAFQNLVWQGLRQIPFGETRSYKQQAIEIGRPETIRAVANANGMNRISILIPCHRVIGADSSLTGYGGGIWRKKWLLDMERANV